MKVVEILKLGQNILKTLQKARIRIEDVRYISLYEDYQLFMNDGYKKSYAIAVLSEKYNISERQVYYLLKRFETDCKVDAV